MKNTLTTLFILCVFVLSLGAQTPPEAFKYQTVIRDASGQILANQNVSIGIDLLQNGTPLYSEDHAVTTNDFGLVNIEVGRGTVVGGSFEDLDWSIPTSIRTLLDATGGTNLQNVGTSELLSVPYALYSGNAGDGSSVWAVDGNNISSSNTGNVGIGTTTPDRKLTVTGNVANDGVMTVNNADTAGFAGTYFESEGTTLGFVGYVGSGSWIEPNSMQIGGVDTDVKIVNNTTTNRAAMTVKAASQDIGIGTTDPNRRLTVEGNIADDGVMTVNNADAAGFAGTYFESEGTALGYVGYVGSGNWVEPNSMQIGGVDTDVKIVNSTTTNRAAMTVKAASQDIGIGTANPNRRLTVEDNVSNDGVMTINNASTAGFAGTYFESGGSLRGYIGYVGSGNWIEPNSMQIGGVNTDIKFVENTSSIALMTIKPNGNVGIGLNNPAYKFAVQHFGTGVQIKNAGSNESWELFHDASSQQLQLRNASNSAVGHFDYNSGAYMATSDRKLKRNVQPIAAILPSLMQLMPVNYHYASDEDEKKHLGFIAQEVEEVFPELVTNPADAAGEEDVYRMNYTGFGVLAVKAIQEQQIIINEQQKVIEAQKARLDAIERALEKAGIPVED